MLNFKKIAVGLPLVGLVALIVAATMVNIVPTGSVSAHVDGVHNATRKKQVAAYGAKADIEGTDPAINGGQWSYHRVGVVQSSPWQYGEIGWLKIDTSFTGYIVMRAPDPRTRLFSCDEGEAHTFVAQWDPNQERHHWFYDGGWVWSDALGFDQADYVICGGEVATGVEGMGDTRCGNGGSNGLLYLMPNGSGGWHYLPWNGHSAHVEDDPYEVEYIDSNNFRATGND